MRARKALRRVLMPLTYDAKKQRLVESLREHHGKALRLAKDTSNLFRDRKEVEAQRLDVRDFNQVLRVDPVAGLPGPISAEDLLGQLHLFWLRSFIDIMLVKANW